MRSRLHFFSSLSRSLILSLSFSFSLSQTSNKNANAALDTTLSTATRGI